MSLTAPATICATPSDASTIQRKCGWAPQETFESSFRTTMEWYLDNLDWCRRVQDGSDRRERLCTAA